MASDAVSLPYNAMSGEQFSLEPWAPTDGQMDAAQFRASGYSAARTAEKCGVHIRTIQRYDADPNFHTLVLKLRAEMMRSLEPKLGALMDAAIEVLMEAMAGRLAGDDPRVQLARDISRDTAFRLLRARVAEQLQRGRLAPALAEDA